MKKKYVLIRSTEMQVLEDYINDYNEDGYKLNSISVTSENNEYESFYIAAMELV